MFIVKYDRYENYKCPYSNVIPVRQSTHYLDGWSITKWTCCASSDFYHNHSFIKFLNMEECLGELTEIRNSFVSLEKDLKELHEKKMITQKDYNSYLDKCQFSNIDIRVAEIKDKKVRYINTDIAKLKNYYAEIKNNILSQIEYLKLESEKINPQRNDNLKKLNELKLIYLDLAKCLEEIYLKNKISLNSYEKIKKKLFDMNHLNYHIDNQNDKKNPVYTKEEMLAIEGDFKKFELICREEIKGVIDDSSFNRSKSKVLSELFSARAECEKLNKKIKDFIESNKITQEYGDKLEIDNIFKEIDEKIENQMVSNDAIFTKSEFVDLMTRIKDIEFDKLNLINWI